MMKSMKKSESDKKDESYGESILLRSDYFYELKLRLNKEILSKLQMDAEYFQFKSKHKLMAEVEVTKVEKNDESETEVCLQITDMDIVTDKKDHEETDKVTEKLYGA